MTRAEKAAVREQWRAGVAGYKASGLSAVEWREGSDLETRRLWHWLRELKKEKLTQKYSE